MYVCVLITTRIPQIKHMIILSKLYILYIFKCTYTLIHSILTLYNKKEETFNIFTQH